MTEHAHGPTSKSYVMVFAALVVLTSVTVGIANTGLAPGVKTFLAFAIATIKVLLVATIFMHLRYEKWTIVVFAVVPVLLAILFILAISPDIGIVQ